MNNVNNVNSPARDVTETTLHFWLARVVIVIHPHHPARVEFASQLHIRLYARKEAAGDVAVDAEGDDVLSEAASFGGVPAAGVAGRRRRRLGTVGPLAGAPHRLVGGARRGGRREGQLGPAELDPRQRQQKQQQDGDCD